MKGVTDEEFIRAWQTGKDAKQVAGDLGMEYAACRSRAAYYRRLGIPLRKFQSEARAAGQLPRLRALAESLAPKKCPCGRGEDGLCISCFATARRVG